MSAIKPKWPNKQLRDDEYPLHVHLLNETALGSLSVQLCLKLESRNKVVKLICVFKYSAITKTMMFRKFKILDALSLLCRCHIDAFAMVERIMSYATNFCAQAL
jgi:hypothetical protein